LEKADEIRAPCLAAPDAGHVGAAAADALSRGAGAGPASAINSGDTAWMLTSVALVLMMTIPGLALFYGGMVRKMNVLTTVMQSFAITCLITVLWTVVTYSFAFTTGSPFLGGMSRFLLYGMTLDTVNDLAKTIPESVYMCFQMTFAIITPALICGAIADRMKFSALLWFIGLWAVCVYAPIAHWVWGADGFLNDAGVLDFAGGTVVHINSGVAGLMAALVNRVWDGADASAQPCAQRHRRLVAVGGLVRVQCRFCDGGQRQCRHGNGGNPDCDRDRRALLDVCGVDRKG
jgi:Amt family ammonium transporter